VADKWPLLIARNIVARFFPAACGRLCKAEHGRLSDARLNARRMVRADWLKFGNHGLWSGSMFTMVEIGVMIRFWGAEG
jgi:hypothetical protein